MSMARRSVYLLALLAASVSCDSASTIRGVVVEARGVDKAAVILSSDGSDAGSVYRALPGASVSVADVTRAMPWLEARLHMRQSLDGADLLRIQREIDFAKLRFSPAAKSDEQACFFRIVSVPSVRAQVLVIRVGHPITGREYHAIYLKRTNSATMSIILPGDGTAGDEHEPVLSLSEHDSNCR